eukprot:GHVO01014117.1.p1 GENE.GHVO01014117.1~~GHVO01014117.1.p1  ORF type:complete len:117 (-),score=2.71 GHVO01014117.1:56-406(-)
MLQKLEFCEGVGRNIRYYELRHFPCRDSVPRRQGKNCVFRISLSQCYISRSFDQLTQNELNGAIKAAGARLVIFSLLSDEQVIRSITDLILNLSPSPWPVVIPVSSESEGLHVHDA